MGMVNTPQTPVQLPRTHALLVSPARPRLHQEPQLHPFALRADQALMQLNPQVLGATAVQQVNTPLQPALQTPLLVKIVARVSIQHQDIAQMRLLACCVPRVKCPQWLELLRASYALLVSLQLPARQFARIV